MPTLASPAATVRMLRGLLPTVTLGEASAARVVLDRRIVERLQVWLAGPPAQAFQHRATGPRLRIHWSSLVGDGVVDVDPHSWVGWSMLDDMLARPSGAQPARALAQALLAQAMGDTTAESLKLSIQSLERQRAPERAVLRPCLRVKGCVLEVVEIDAGFAVFAADELRRAPRAAPPDWQTMALRPTIMLGTRDWPLAVVRRLAPGDLALLGTLPRTVEWRVGGSRGHAAAARIDPDLGALRLEARPASTDDRTDMYAPPPSESIGDIGEIELPLRFEIDASALDLASILTLSAGQVVALDVPLSEARVQIRCHGQTIGHGQLVAVGEQLGVRIDRVRWDQHESASR